MLICLERYQKNCLHTDHTTIEIKEGARIPNIRPYRYPHRQKKAIEAFATDTLMSGLT
ncbi:hypothetical protein A2U01_0021312, partial [Trifolium medium]|nr:hypothetical protein [Trifolium medium]